MIITVNSYTLKYIIADLKHIGNMWRMDKYILNKDFPYVTDEEVIGFLKRKFDLTNDTKYDFNLLASEFKCEVIESAS